MFFLMVAAQQVTFDAGPMPRVPPPPPPFTSKVEAVARRIGARVNDEFKRCGDARANSNARSIEAFGTPRYSAEWNKAALAMNNALTVCRGLRRALRDQKNFLVGIAQKGSKYDRGLAAGQLIGVSYELDGIEQYFATETPKYRELLTVGWGSPHCAEHPDGFMPPSSICPKPTGDASVVKPPQPPGGQSN